jgi:hypothetical protein
MAVRFRTEIVQVEGVPASKWENFERRARKQATTAGLLHWRDNFLPLHFGQKASERYGYAKRDFSYLYYVKKQLRHLKPNEQRGTTWSDRNPLRKTGTLRDNLSQGDPKFSVRKKGAETVMVLPAPKYLYMWRRRTKSPGAAPNKAAELTKMLPEEEAEMMAVTETVYEAEMATLPQAQASAARRLARQRAAAQATGYGEAA